MQLKDYALPRLYWKLPGAVLYAIQLENGKVFVMSDVSQKVVQMLLQTEAIQVYREKPFVFVSGRISPVYIDCRKLLSFADEREYIVTQLEIGRASCREGG